jgi:hypothetical protein
MLLMTRNGPSCPWQSCGGAVDRIRDVPNGIERTPQLADRLFIGAAPLSHGTSLVPACDCLARKPCLAEMMGDDLRFGHRRETLDQRFGDLCVQLLAPTLEQCGIRGVLYQGVLERVGRFRRHSAPGDETGASQSFQRRVEFHWSIDDALRRVWPYPTNAAQLKTGPGL